MEHPEIPTSTLNQPENPGQYYKRLFLSFVASLTEYGAKMDALAQEEIAVTGETESYMLIFGWAGRDRITLIQKKAEAVFRFLIRCAEMEFSPPGSRFEIDTNKFRRFTENLRKEEAWHKFDPESMWNALEAEYGGQNGEDEAFRQTATKIISAFRIRPGKPMEFKQGGLVLNINVYIDSIDKKYSNKNRLHYSSQESVSTALLSLAGFATWAREIDSLHAIKAYVNQLHYNRHDDLKSREKIPLGQIRLTTYFNRFEFHFSKSFGEQLQIFLATYALEKLQAAA